MNHLFKDSLTPSAEMKDDPRKKELTELLCRILHNKLGIHFNDTMLDILAENLLASPMFEEKNEEGK